MTWSRKLIDLTGRRFGRLVVESRAGRAPDGRALWWCQCDCGARQRVRGYSLRMGGTRSCGCLRSEVAATLRRLAAARRAG